MVDVEFGWEAEDIRFGEVHPLKLDSFYRSPTGPLTPSASIKLRCFISIFTPICLRPSLSVHQDDGSKASTLCPWLLAFLIIFLLDVCWFHITPFYSDHHSTHLICFMYPLNPGL